VSKHKCKDTPSFYDIEKCGGEWELVACVWHEVLRIPIDFCPWCGERLPFKKGVRVNEEK